MDYTEVRIYIAKEHIEPLTCMLSDMGVGGFVVEDPEDFRELMEKKQGYEWDYVDEELFRLEEVPVNLSFYLEDNLEGLDLLEQVVYAAEDFPVEKMEIRQACDSDWKDKWKEYFKPARITDRVVVKPSWEEYKAGAGDLIIEIDPGMAFGTGTHPTTTLCIQALERYIRPGESRVLDVGCGSGILSIAAALLGAKTVLGVEIDPDALAVARENAAINGLSERIQLQEGDLTRGLSFTGDVIAANLMADLVMMLAEDANRHLTPGGVFISSGILTEKQEVVAKAVAGSGFEILEIPVEGEWCAVIARKTAEVAK